MNDSSRKKIILWLLCGCFFIFSMVVIGGITRLTGSGLSITEWNVIMGTVPPLNHEQWNTAFEKYKEIPQYKLLNYNYTLGDFKKIFFWEYLHRFIGRMIGVVFLVPFLYFYVSGQFDKSTLRKCILLFVLGGFQGFLGWFMVKSGLTERTSVSHYRLAIHLVAAFLTFAFTLWFALELIYKNVNRNSLLKKKYSGMIMLLSGLVIVQIVYGAFVAGLHAGKFANTFPTMDGEWIPSGLFASGNFIANFFENPVAVQFIHRTLAFAILIITYWLWVAADKKAMNRSQRRGINLLLFAVSLQFLLGVITLLSAAEITLASLHQVGAFILFSSVIFLLFHFRQEKNGSEIVST
jgi:cytochrome c oxidase assembly protein subunit 15